MPGEPDPAAVAAPDPVASVALATSVAGTGQGAATHTPAPVYEAAKRILDLAVAATALVLVSPILAAAALAIRLETPGAAIFRQTRVGRDGRDFVLVKFRGMYEDARQRFPRLYDYDFDPAELADLRFHPERDPRVTGVGRFLRRTSIDELPNLVNVLRGEMSLVGPRPEIPEMLPHYGAAAPAILSVKPGVTSLAKVSGRDELTFRETLDLDLEYVRRRSLRLDLVILMRTAVSVARQDGVK